MARFAGHRCRMTREGTGYAAVDAISICEGEHALGSWWPSALTAGVGFVARIRSKAFKAKGSR